MCVQPRCNITYLPETHLSKFFVIVCGPDSPTISKSSHLWHAHRRCYTLRHTVRSPRTTHAHNIAAQSRIHCRRSQISIAPSYISNYVRVTQVAHVGTWNQPPQGLSRTLAVLQQPQLVFLGGVHARNPFVADSTQQHMVRTCYCVGDSFQHVFGVGRDRSPFNLSPRRSASFAMFARDWAPRFPFNRSVSPRNFAFPRHTPLLTAAALLFRSPSVRTPFDAVEVPHGLPACRYSVVDITLDQLRLVIRV